MALDAPLLEGALIVVYREQGLFPPLLATMAGRAIQFGQVHLARRGRNAYPSSPSVHFPWSEMDLFGMALIAVGTEVSQGGNFPFEMDDF